MGMWPSGERSRMARRRLPSPMYPPSGKRRSQSPESSGPRCVCTCVMRASVSASPQFASPLIPHMTSAPRVPQFVDFCLGVKHLHSLESAIDQPWNPVKKSQTKSITIEKEQHRRARQAIELSLEPSSALCLRAEKGGAHLLRALVRTRQHPRLPVGIFIVLLNVA